MDSKQGKGILDVSVNAVLDVTPRKAGKLVWVVLKRLSGSETRKLRKQVESLRIQVGSHNERINDHVAPPSGPHSHFEQEMTPERTGEALKQELKDAEYDQEPFEA